MSARLVGGYIYVEMPARYHGPTGDRLWVRGSLSELLGKDALNQYDPTRSLALLSAQTDSIVAVGRQVVNGTTTTHYRAVMDLAKGSSTPLARRLYQDTRASLGASRLPVDAWIDASGRLVRVQMHLELRRPPNHRGTKVNAAAYPMSEVITESLSSYGLKFAVSPPPADDVAPVDLGAILKSEGF